ncbi:MAG: Crp/Fnr family transcriptional regulator [Clostridia bacterium]|nr:Crp/Fnr family transcriptional regulator [Clostridia bacterium]
MNNFALSLSLAPVDTVSAERYHKLLTPLGEILEFSAKQVVLDLQESTEFICMLLTGRTAHYITDGTDDKLLYHLTPGRIFGNLAHAEGKLFPTRAIAMEKVVVLRIPRAKYLELIHNDPVFALEMMDMQCDYDKYLLCELHNLSFNSCKARLMRIYCSQIDHKRLEDGKWYSLRSKLTHNELAAIVGSARVTISKLINELCDDGFIRIINRRAQVSKEAYDKFVAEHAE